MRYKGGKGADGVYHKIINQIPPHRTFIDAFYGGGSITKYIRRAACSLAVDLDASVLASVPDGVIAVHGDAISFLRSYAWEGGEFVYADPPYLMETRSYKKPIYKYELATRAQHEELLGVLLSLPCMVAISGYWSELYADLLKSWRVISFMVGTSGGFAAQEYLWMNYAEPQALQDYRYLGNNFRERANYTRQQKRWRAKLARMSPLQRYALLSVLDDQR